MIVTITTLFFSDRKQPPSFSALGDAPGNRKFRNPHSNAFVDLNDDGNADILVTTEDGFELWENREAVQSSWDTFRALSSGLFLAHSSNKTKKLQ